MHAGPIGRGLWPLLAASITLFSSGFFSIGPARPDQWFRGNTHTHTLNSDGDAEPEVVAKWYHDRGYNFLVITDHNKFINPKTVKLPADKRHDFILIPGEEITGSKLIHTTAMNISTIASWQYDDANKSNIIQRHVDETMRAGGAAILNHPNFYYAVAAEDILPVQRLYMFELFNGHPSVNNGGDHSHPSTEAIWDHLLTAGMKIFAVASDDAHHYQEFSPKKANPGRGWVMVRAAELEADAITNAMLRGDFYTSNGVFLKTYRRGSSTYSVEVDAERTRQEVVSLPSICGKHVENASEGFRIEFIGLNGDILDTITGEKGHFRINPSTPYVRARVTFTRKDPQQQGFEEYNAWGQPVFTDARAGMEASKRGEHN